MKLAGLRFKSEKLFAQIEVGYLGCVVFAEGLQNDPAKLQTLIEFPVPTKSTGT